MFLEFSSAEISSLRKTTSPMASSLVEPTGSGAPVGPGESDQIADHEHAIV